MLSTVVDVLYIINNTFHKREKNVVASIQHETSPEQ